MKRLKGILLGLIILLVIGYFGISYSLSNRVLFPTGSNLNRVKEVISEEWGMSYDSLVASLPKAETFEVNGFGDITLSGKYYKKSDSSACAIIFAHGWGELWAGMLKYVSIVEQCNCDYVFYDHRVHGESGGKYATAGINESKDLLKVTDWVATNKDIKKTNIAWVGSSWGAATSIIAGSTNQDVGLILADAPYQDWYSAIFERAIKDYGSGIKFVSWGVMNMVNLRAGVDYKDASPKNAISNVIEPVFLIHSKADSATNHLQSINISKGLNSKSIFYNTNFGNDHVMDVVNNTDEIKELLNAFLVKEAPQFLPKKDSIKTTL